MGRPSHESSACIGGAESAGFELYSAWLRSAAFKWPAGKISESTVNKQFGYSF